MLLHHTAKRLNFRNTDKYKSGIGVSRWLGCAGITNWAAPFWRFKGPETEDLKIYRVIGANAVNARLDEWVGQIERLLAWSSIPGDMLCPMGKTRERRTEINRRPVRREPAKTVRSLKGAFAKVGLCLLGTHEL